MSGLGSETTQAPAAGDRRRGVLLAAVLTAVFVVPLSVSGTAVALAGISNSLGRFPVGEQWALNGFNVTFAASTLAWGSLADRIGRWVAFQLGTIVFIVGSVLSVLASDYLLLDAARILAGLGAGAIFSVGSALLSVVYTGPRRARVFALLGVMAGLSLAFGPTLCGLVTQVLSWRAIFAIQGTLLVVSLVLMLAGRGVQSGEPRADTPFDWPAAVLFSAGTATLVSALVIGSNDGWGSGLTSTLVVAALVLFLGLVWRERSTPHPLLDLALLRRSRFLGVSLVVAVASFTFAAFVTYAPSLMQAAFGYAPAASGAFVMSMTVPTLVMPLIAGVFVARNVPARRVLTAAVVLMVAGAGSLAIAVGVAPWAMAVAMVLLGAGFGLHAGLADNEGLAAVSDHDAGMAAGWINTMRLGTEAIGVSLFGAVFIPALSGSHPAGAYRSAGLASSVLALILAVAVIRALNRRASQ